MRRIMDIDIGNVCQRKQVTDFGVCLTRQSECCTFQHPVIAKAAQSLKVLDKNGDGKLTPDEYRWVPPGGAGPGGRDLSPGQRPPREQ